MRLYVETNFLLEWVLEQQESADVDAIVGLAEARDIELVVPAACLLEAYVAMQGREGKRKALIRQMEHDLGDLGRTLSLAAEVSMLKGMVAQANVSMQSRYERVRARMLASGVVIAMDHRVAHAAAMSSYALSVPDALVFESVLADLTARPVASAAFVTRNSKDFDTPDVRNALASHHCALLFKFGAAHARARARLSSSP